MFYYNCFSIDNQTFGSNYRSSPKFEELKLSHKTHRSYSTSHVKTMRASQTRSSRSKSSSLRTNPSSRSNTPSSWRRNPKSWRTKINYRRKNPDWRRNYQSQDRRLPVRRALPRRSPQSLGRRSSGYVKSWVTRAAR